MRPVGCILSLIGWGLVSVLSAKRRSQQIATLPHIWCPIPDPKPSLSLFSFCWYLQIICLSVVLRAVFGLELESKVSNCSYICYPKIQYSDFSINWANAVFYGDTNSASNTFIRSKLHTLLQKILLAENYNLHYKKWKITDSYSEQRDFFYLILEI